MTSQVFYRKWRPQLLAEVVGQEHVTQTLLNALANGRISHAYLFCGPRGTGKTSTARGLAKAVNCLTNGKGEPCNTCSMCQAITEGRALDVIEVDAASNTGVDDIRSLREKVNYAPNEARYKVYIIDEVHMLSTSASNALLKTLEEPPPHVIFVLATTETHKLLPTILSRCQRFDFRRLLQADIIAKLANISGKEGITIEPEALKLIARAATGSLRDAENLLQQTMTYYGNEINLKQVQELLGITGDQRAKELVKNIIGGDIAGGVALINNVNNDGLDLRQFNRDMVEYLRLLLLVKTGSSESLELTAEDISELKELAGKASLSQILKAVKRFGQLDIGLDNYSTLPLELALVDSSQPDSEAKPEPARQAEPRPVVTNPSAKAAPPSQPRPQVVQPEEKKEPDPEPAATEPATEPVAQEKPVPEPVAEETPVPPEPEEKHESPLAAGDAIEQLQQQWIKIINEAPGGLAKTPAAALLRSGSKPISIEGETIVVAFKFSYHIEKMGNMDNQKTAEKIVSSFMGRPYKVRCVFEHENDHLVKAALNMGAQYDNSEEK
jgi:DNA polymerase-3 subunit gamma/tau